MTIWLVPPQLSKIRIEQLSKIRIDFVIALLMERKPFESAARHHSKELFASI